MGPSPLRRCLLRRLCYSAGHVNKKVKKFDKEGYECIPHVFNHRFHGYICKKKELQENTSNTEINFDQYSRLVQLVESKIKGGVTFETMYTYLDKTLNIT